MIVVFDASLLVYLLDEGARPPIDPSTGVAVTDCPSRIRHLVDTLQEERAKIVVPTPALAEVLVRAGNAAPEWLRILKGSKHFLVVPFDDRHAVEFAARQVVRLSHGIRDTTRAKAKFDDQIVAMAAVEGASVIYSDDHDIRRAAGPRLKVVGIAELPVPAPSDQMHLGLPDPPSSGPGMSEDSPDWGRF